MKLQFEKVDPNAGNSFRLIHLTEAQTCTFYWHYHPEYEIVFIPTGSGHRRVGTHVSRYEGGELVFIGPNLPHLNFSYGKEGRYEEIIVQLRADFLGTDAWQSAEFGAIQRLFERGKLGLSFGTDTKQRLEQTLLNLPQQPTFERLLTLLRVLNDLATAPDVQPLHTGDIQFDLNPKEQARINRVCQFVEANHASPIDIRLVADLAGLTVPAFCRYFKRVTHQTFTEFVNEFRVNQARGLLQSARTVADVGFAVGFNNLSHFNKTFRAITGQTPGGYRKTIGSQVG